MRLALPIGLVYDARGEVILDPDTGVRRAVQLLFDTFADTASAFATVKAFRGQQLTFPGRHRGGPHAGELYWKPLTHSQVLKMLHNPATEPDSADQITKYGCPTRQTLQTNVNL